MLTTGLACRTWSSNPASGSPPSYRTFPSHSRRPSNAPSYNPPPYTFRSATSTQPPRPRPHQTDGSFQEETPTAIGCGPVICVAIMLIQAVLIICRSDALATFIDLRSATLRASEERGKLELERGKLRREREFWERAREDRVPQGAFWEVISPAPDCRAYGRREYWGILRNIPEGWTAIDACMNMPAEIKNVTVRRPDRCAFVQGSPDILAHWMVDWDEPDCKPWYQEFHDTVSPIFPPSVRSGYTHTAQGCTSRGSGTRRIEAHIVGILKEQDWRLMCASTPLVWNQITYTSPTHCDERVREP